MGAYRFLLRLPSTVGPEQVREIILSTDPALLDGILALALKRTSLFRWKLVQVAKKFGAIDVDADYERFSIYRLLDLFEGTVIQEEASRDSSPGIWTSRERRASSPPSGKGRSRSPRGLSQSSAVRGSSPPGT